MFLPKPVMIHQHNFLISLYEYVYVAAYAYRLVHEC